jgi:ABC-2 type transport system ATP-binding protein
VISVNSLSKSYGSNKVLDGINLCFKPGEVHGIVGKNGSGKSTLFKCLLDLESSRGTIELDSNKKLKNVSGYLPTNPPILSKITGTEYMRLLCSARGLAFNGKEPENIFDLPLQEYIETYSTGMLKKLALMGILAQQNEVFVLDEPFNGLDYQSCLIVTALVHRLKEANKTIIISSHIFSTLKESCDFIHYLDNGVISRTADKEHFDEIEHTLQKELIVDKLSKLKF